MSGSNETLDRKSVYERKLIDGDIHQNEEWMKEFKLIAKENDFITKDDLEKFWQRSNKNPSKEEVYTLCQQEQIEDLDGAGKITATKFVSINQAAQKAKFYNEDSYGELVEALKCFDTRNDNTIPREELKAILPDYEETLLEDVLNAADKYGDGNLSITDLAASLTKQTKS